MPPSMLALLALVLAPLPALAQGTLANQGFGYPFGQLSTRALATGGAVVEFDPRSPVNPASLGATGRVIFLQYEPEFRSISGNGADESQRFIRYPLVGAVLPIGSRFTLGLSASTLLDRTGESIEERTEIVGEQPVTFEEIVRSDGAMNDLRLAGSYALTEAVRMGFGVHAITGEFRQILSRRFDTPGFDSLGLQSRASFSGFAVSGGVMWRVARGITVAGSGRFGGEIEAFVNDTSRSTAEVPHRLGIGIGVERLSGVAFAAHAAWESWTNFEGLGSEQVNVHDVQEYGIGAEVAGPTLFGTNIPVRLGFRWRGLPFSPNGDQVMETALGGGVAVPLLAGLSVLELGVQQARRSNDLPFRERSLLFSFGLTIRP